METLDKQDVVMMEELTVSSRAQTDALTKLLIEKGLITKAEFMQKLSAERAGYRVVFAEDEVGAGYVSLASFFKNAKQFVKCPFVQSGNSLQFSGIQPYTSAGRTFIHSDSLIINLN